MNSLAGHILIAAPSLSDPNFRRTVVLIIKHDAEGALGLILNRPAPLPFHEVWEKLSNEPCPIEAPLFVGGPCGGPLMALHTSPDLSDIAGPDDVGFTADITKIRELITRVEPTMKLFGGYSGWGPGQLEGELQVGGWHTMSADAQMIFGPHNELWQKLYESLVRRANLPEWLGIKQVPPDPSMN